MNRFTCKINGTISNSKLSICTVLYRLLPHGPLFFPTGTGFYCCMTLLCICPLSVISLSPGFSSPNLLWYDLTLKILLKMGLERQEDTDSCNSSPLLVPVSLSFLLIPTSSSLVKIISRYITIVSIVINLQLIKHKECPQ